MAIMESIDIIQSKIYSQMTFSQKWEVVVQLRQAAWSLKKAFVKEKHPDWTEEQIDNEVKKIFLYAST